LPAEAAEARRHAVNTIIQGTSADLLKLALVRLHEVLPAEVRMLLSVHDSVLLEVPEHLVEATRRQTIATMQALPPQFNIPLKVAVKAGRTWAECKR
jgi:DNA polymerase I